MKICTVIAEYNPLHSGHVRLLNFARTLADTVIVVMSGNFTQRGMPAVASKYERARWAIAAGADLVVELPTVFCTQSANVFATGGVKIAEMLSSQYLCFGSECGDVERLKSCAEAILLDKKGDSVKAEMKRGVSYPSALSAVYNEYSDILDKPNDTLAIEYIKALLTLDSGITPVTLKRDGEYNCDELNGDFASASAMRKDPKAAFEKGYISGEVFSDIDVSVEEKYRLFAQGFLSLSDAEMLSQIEDATEGLHNKIYQNRTKSFDDIIESVKSKRYTWLRLQRVILNAILGIKAGNAALVKDSVPPVNVLAVSKSRRDELLKHVAKLHTSSSEFADYVKTINQRADDLFWSLSGKTPPKRLNVL
jgi:cytidyltransferase-like protein